MSITAYNHHLKNGIIVADIMGIGNRRYFTMETMEGIKRKIRDMENYTIKEICMMVMVPTLTGGWKHPSSDTIRRNLTQKRMIDPVGKRGNAPTFSMAAIQMVVKSERWKVVESPE